MDEDMPDIDDIHWEPVTLEDHPVFSEYERMVRRSSLGSSDPVEDENDQGFLQEEGEEYYEEEYDEDADSLVGDMEEGATFEEVDPEESQDQLQGLEGEDAELPDDEFASKANDMAGVREITEKEAKSLRQGPAVTKKEKKGESACGG